MNVAVFASGGGTNFQALLDHKESGELHVDFVLCVGNNSKAKVFERAAQRGIPTLHIAPSHFSDENEYHNKLSVELKKHKVELIVLAGYMKKLPDDLVRTYANRIINIHPALLPAFGGRGMYGKRVHQAVLDYGAKVTGVTVHFVDEEYDNGPVILQEPVGVEDDDTVDSLAERVLALEHAVYWRAVEAISRGEIRLEGRRVIGVKGIGSHGALRI